ncbi:GIY-YIG nuclease family protein [Ginsengibacter hankyongi]|uniref:GIY-YIG nuclease family protein n=1 Tax=Ginsengibacter hankyongi TaxID=2607284 RepID=A0A5J5I9Z2_9BACT|nr:GIY-YIG nuclease family protein [Ginsengibacter hankyongi]KAA9034599.1 GIY-YIG nuclease family protein [Ginsengibacter hankyongi]
MNIKQGGCVYIITNKNNTVLYTGVTSDLRGRIWEHKSKFFPNSFSAKYNCEKIVWYEVFPTIGEAIEREKQIKAGSRKKKLELIKIMNPDWKDLWDEIQEI